MRAESKEFRLHTSCGCRDACTGQSNDAPSFALENKLCHSLEAAVLQRLWQRALVDLIRHFLSHPDATVFVSVVLAIELGAV